MNRIRILIFAAVIAFVISGFLGEHGSSPASTLDSLLTLGFLAYIWHAMRRATGSPPKDEERRQTPAPPSGEPDADRPEPAPQTEEAAPWNRQPEQTPPRIIHHKTPWSVVEKGETVGSFRNSPIHAWIRTSDNRQADYSGITPNPPPAESVCLEIPERRELILPPGLVYAIRSS